MKKEHEKYLTEGKDDIKKIADSFTRYLIGNSDTAIRELQKMVGFVRIPAMQNPADYNNVYGKLYGAIFKAITSIIKD